MHISVSAGSGVKGGDLVFDCATASAGLFYFQFPCPKFSNLII